MEARRRRSPTGSRRARSTTRTSPRSRRCCAAARARGRARGGRRSAGRTAGGTAPALSTQSWPSSKCRKLGPAPPSPSVAWARIGPAPSKHGCSPTSGKWQPWAKLMTRSTGPPAGGHERHPAERLPRGHGPLGSAPASRPGRGCRARTGSVIGPTQVRAGWSRPGRRRRGSSSSIAAADHVGRGGDQGGHGRAQMADGPPRMASARGSHVRQGDVDHPRAGRRTAGPGAPAPCRCRRRPGRRGSWLPLTTAGISPVAVPQAWRAMATGGLVAVAAGQPVDDAAAGDVRAAPGRAACSPPRAITLSGFSRADLGPARRGGTGPEPGHQQHQAAVERAGAQGVGEVVVAGEVDLVGAAGEPEPADGDGGLEPGVAAAAARQAGRRRWAATTPSGSAPARRRPRPASGSSRLTSPMRATRAPARWAARGAAARHPATPR